MVLVGEGDLTPPATVSSFTCSPWLWPLANYRYNMAARMGKLAKGLARFGKQESETR